MTTHEDDALEETKSGLGRFQRIALGTLATIFVASIGCRFFYGASPAAGPASGALADERGAIPAGAQGFVQGDTPPSFGPGAGSAEAPVVEQSGVLESLLPVLTEASFFAMIGFALGYASRKVVKLAMIVLACFFVLLQLLTYGGVTTIDWSKLVELLNDWILNLKQNQTFTDVLTDRVPTAGSLIAGYFLGFRRG